MNRAAALFIALLSAAIVTPAEAQIRETPKFAKGGKPQGDAWAEVNCGPTSIASPM